MERKLKIFIVEDHEAIIESWIRQLEACPEFEIVGFSTTAQGIYHNLKQHKIDILILDLILPVSNINQYSTLLGYDILDFIKNNNLDTRVIVISTHEEASFLSRARSKGAMGYLNKKVTKNELVTAIKTVGFDEKEYFDKELLSRLIINLNPDGINLTQRERVILQYISEGMTSKKIAEMLHLSHETIKEYRDGLIRKFDAKNTAHLIKIAVENGYLIEPR